MIRRLAFLLGPSQTPVLRRYLALTMTAGAVQGVTFALGVPVLARLLAGDVAGALPWLCGFLLGAVACWTLDHVATLRGFDTAIALLSTLRHRIGAHVATLPLGWFTRERTSRLGATLSKGVMDILGLPAHQLSPLIRATVTPLALVASVAVYDLRLAVVAGAALPLVAGTLWWSGRLGRRADADVHDSLAQATDRMLEFARSQPVLRAFGQADVGGAQLDHALVAQQRAERRQLLRTLPPMVLNGSITRLAFLALLGTAVSLAVGAEDPAEVVTIVALLVALSRVLEPLCDVASYGAGIRMAAAEIDAVEAILTAPPLPEPDAPAPPPTRFDVELRDVTFGYDGEHPVVRGCSFVIPEGTTTALVGPSGSGKTTVARLVARFWDVTAGAVRIGGVDVRDVRSDDLMGMISTVFQDSYLFSGTLWENVRIARPDATADEVWQAADLARVSELLERLPDGWGTQVGEGGARLSGGERQRVAIARALLKDAPVVLLDEATGALDAENQAAVTAGLSTLRGRCTMLVIAHQLPTIVHADQILVLDRGRVVERGTHQELSAMDDRYAAFWRAREAAEGWRLVDR